MIGILINETRHQMCVVLQKRCVIIILDLWPVYFEHNDTIHLAWTVFFCLFVCLFVSDVVRFMQLQVWTARSQYFTINKRNCCKQASVGKVEPALAVYNLHLH